MNLEIHLNCLAKLGLLYTAEKCGNPAVATGMQNELHKWTVVRNVKQSHFSLVGGNLIRSFYGLAHISAQTLSHYLP